MLLLESTVIVVGSKNRVLEVVDTVFITVPADSIISTSKLSPDVNGAADEAPLFDTVSFW